MREAETGHSRPGLTARENVPGGTMDLGERIVETVLREVREETGLDVEVTGLVGVYSDPGHVIAYDDSEVRQEFNLCFAARPGGRRTRGQR